MGRYLKNAKAIDPVTGEVSYINGCLCKGCPSTSNPFLYEDKEERSYSNDEEMTDEELNEYMKREEDWMNETYELNKDYFEDENAQREYWLKLTKQKL